MSNVNEVRAALVAQVEAAQERVMESQRDAQAAQERVTTARGAKLKSAKQTLAAAQERVAEAQKAHASAAAALADHDKAQAAAAPKPPLAQAYNAEYTIPQVARPAAGAPPVDVSQAPKNSVSVPHNGAYDSLKGRVGARTHIMHVILCEAYARGERLTASTITARVNVVWARALAGAPTTEAATSSHLNTMRKRGFYAHGALTKRAYLALTRGVAPETISASECDEPQSAN